MTSDTPWRVVVVDDEEDFVILISRVLRDDTRFEVVGTACSVSTALVQLEAERPDLVVLDHGLPDAWGVQAARSLRSVSEGSHIVICSAAMQTTDADPVYIDGWVDKGDLFDLPDVLAAMMHVA